MKLFIDSDILLDAILMRAPYDQSASKLLSLTNKRNYTLCASAHSLLNVFYFTRKLAGKPAAVRSVSLLEEELQILPTESIAIRKAIHSGFSDVEDAVQYELALIHHCDLIITRNLKDYNKAELPVMTA
ncbi:MAG: PIN domain-containing protein, partial [Flavitalea sp.]